MRVTKSHLKDLTYHVTGAAIEVHKSLGPGLLESVYHKCLKHELELRRINFTSEFRVPISYKGIIVEVDDLRCDFLVEDILPLELKSVEKLLPIHDAQILTYIKLLSAPKGILLNFNVVNLYNDGPKTFVSESFRNLPFE